MKNTFVIILVLFLCHNRSISQKNKLDKQGQRTGKWTTYLDSAKTVKSFEGRFRKGNPVGTCYYYKMDGVLERKEINRFKILKTTFYYPDKTKRLKGQAKIDNTSEKIHYYFYGKWKYYDEAGKLLKYCYYDKGQLVKTKYVDKNNTTNDSLINTLAEIEKTFLEKNEDIINKINSATARLLKTETYCQELMKQDSLSFVKIETILSRYGYPSVKLAKESTHIPFFIISYGSIVLREKYLELFKNAADKGDLAWSSLVFFIDKLQVTKGEQQLYGTQFYFDQNNKKIVYPIFEPENLNNRRKAIGLPEIEN